MHIELGSIVPIAFRSSFERARTALCKDDVVAARPLFDQMAAALPENVEVRLYAAWAHARLASSRSDDEREELERLAREALGAHLALALPLCILAHAAARRGELRVARRLFRHAAEADPALLDARRGERMLERKLRCVQPARPSAVTAATGLAVAAALAAVGLAAALVHS